MQASRVTRFAALSENYSALKFHAPGDLASQRPSAVKTVSKLNGISIATLDTKGPVSSLSLVAVSGGSRSDSPQFPGVSHFWKNLLIRSVPGDNIVRTIQETELRGNTLSTGFNRESLFLSTSFLRDDLVDAVPLLFNNFFNKSMEAYEFLDARSFIEEETKASLKSSQVVLSENLHRVAFRSGLGNSLFAGSTAAHSLKRSHLMEFAEKHFTNDRLVLVGTGVNHADLVKIANGVSAELETFGATGVKVATPKYYGGEISYQAGPTSVNHAILAFPSASLKSQDYSVALVLEALLGGVQYVKYGSTVSGLLGASAKSGAQVFSFQTSYSDAGLFGFKASGTAAELTPALQNAIHQLKAVANGSISEELIQRAKKAALIKLEMSTPESLLNQLAIQTHVLGTFNTSKDLAISIGKVSGHDLATTAKVFLKTKPSLSTYGNAATLPYLDHLKF